MRAVSHRPPATSHQPRVSSDESGFGTDHWQLTAGTGGAS
jgi:hypothetical protein